MNTPVAPRPGPVAPHERFPVLDVLRGLALFGICLANFPEFSLYSFLPPAAAAALPTADADKVVRLLLSVFVDGKFYTLFSLLFGIGFSIILDHVGQRRGGIAVFYRRMLILLVFGFLHLMFLWSGDILMLYALIGMTLPLFGNVPSRRLLAVAAGLLLLPIAIDAAKEFTGFNPSEAVVRMQRAFCAQYGITDENFAYWLRDAETYPGMLRFLVQGAFVRMQEFIDGNRMFKVGGLFLIGFVLGRNRLYARLGEYAPVLKRALFAGAGIGLPVSILAAWHTSQGAPWGQTAQAALYVLGVFPLGFAYMAAVALWYNRYSQSALLSILAAPGRMALTNYIGQSAAGVALFYGVGFGLGAQIGLSRVAPIAAAVYLAGAALSYLWLRAFAYGPLEWVWRMLTYGQRLPLALPKAPASPEYRN